MNHQHVDDGVIKYQAIHTKTDLPPTHDLLKELDDIRTKLFDYGLIGAYPNGVGYGNVSIRNDVGCIISGTSTGSLRTLGEYGYCYVRTFDLEQNIVHTEGPINASSESMTHCAIYQAHNLVQSVLHIHNRELWQTLLDQGHPSTASDIPYGTPQMARSMATLVNNKKSSNGLLVMAGHEEGIVAYGETIAIAFNQIKKIINNLK